MGKDRLVQQILPIAREFLLGRDFARDRARASAGAADHDAIADLGSGGGTERQRREIEVAERLHQAEAGFEIEAQRVAFHHAAVAAMQPDGFGFSDEIAYRQHQPVIDHDAIAGAFGAQRLGAVSIGRYDRMQSDHRRQRLVEVERVVARARLVCGRHFPFGQSGHQSSPGEPARHRARAHGTFMTM